MPRFPSARFVLTVTLLAGMTSARGQENLPPETKAIISRLKDESKSKSPATRASAYKSMGELGASGVGLRRTLCDGMLDPAVAVRTAAADALKKIDEPLYKTAMAIYIDKHMPTVAGAASSGRRAEPLVPLILPMVAQLSPLASVPDYKDSPFSVHSARVDLSVCLRTLVAIAPDDEVVNKGVLSMLTNAQAANRAVAVDLVENLKNRKLALQPLMFLAVNPKEPDPTRVRAVGLLPLVSDENTRGAARKAAEALRLDSSRSVREAAEAALRRLGE